MGEGARSRKPSAHQCLLFARSVCASLYSCFMLLRHPLLLAFLLHTGSSFQRIHSHTHAQRTSRALLRPSNVAAFAHPDPPTHVYNNVQTRLPFGTTDPATQRHPPQLAPHLTTHCDNQKLHNTAPPPPPPHIPQWEGRTPRSARARSCVMETEGAARLPGGRLLATCRPT